MVTSTGLLTFTHSSSAPARDRGALVFRASILVDVRPFLLMAGHAAALLLSHFLQVRWLPRFSN